MRRLTILEYISLDGVVQAPGGPDEDRDGGFAHGGWSAPFDDPVLDDTISAVHGAPFDLVLGRRTYDIWSAHWPNAAGPLAEGMNAATKFVTTHRPGSLAWGPAQGLGPDIKASVRQLKAGPGPDLLLWGSSAVTPTLLEHSLADEIVLIVIPVLLGSGKRFFAEGTAPRSLNLIRTRTGSTGVTVNTYQPAGPLRTGSFV
jgi:dihydrofolate reductase